MTADNLRGYTPRRIDGLGWYNDFWNSLLPKEQRRIDAALAKLSERGSQALTGIGLTKALGDDLWELRPVPFRIIYFHDDSEQAYVLILGFRKTSRQEQQREMALARDRMNRYRRGKE